MIANDGFCHLRLSSCLVDLCPSVNVEQAGASTPPLPKSMMSCFILMQLETVQTCSLSLFISLIKAHRARGQKGNQREFKTNRNLLFSWLGSSSSSRRSTLPGRRLQCGNSIWRFSRGWCRRHVVCRRPLDNRQRSPFLAYASHWKSFTTIQTALNGYLTFVGDLK